MEYLGKGFERPSLLQLPLSGGRCDSRKSNFFVDRGNLHPTDLGDRGTVGSVPLFGFLCRSEHVRITMTHYL
ncbi:hypothetical protein SLA2020_297710 [Shorea laevis]